MASSDMLTEKLILALNSAKDVIKSEDSQILKKLMKFFLKSKNKKLKKIQYFLVQQEHLLIVLKILKIEGIILIN